MCQYGGESGVDDGGGVADDDGADGVDGVDDDANDQAYTLNFTAHQSSSGMVPVNKTLSKNTMKHDHT